MTNWEKYSNMFNTTEFGLANGEPVLCADIRCEECEWFGVDGECSPAQMQWLKSEYNDHKEKMKQAKIDLLNTLSWNVLCTRFEFCADCPLHILKEKSMDDVTCNTILRAILSEGIKTVIEE